MLVRGNNSIGRTNVEKSWGEEDWIVNNPLYCLKILTVVKDKWTSEGLFHYHKIKDETFYVLEGELILETVYRGSVNRAVLMPGDSYRVTPGVGHRFTAARNICKFIEVSTQHFDSDSYRSELKDLPE